ncbi:hypothetical protein KP509_17G011400 [Ceratopteris richardii]|uniref:Uncharacterized protein n=1 Tax=Ceratopteris richardii TaxID=49495 RepID=A0A8T2SS56_CERRI|nr:hypothetical protein KP509_17G011400 [Ceratopteris richardii]
MFIDGRGSASASLSSSWGSQVKKHFGNRKPCWISQVASPGAVASLAQNPSVLATIILANTFMHPWAQQTFNSGKTVMKNDKWGESALAIVIARDTEFVSLLRAIACLPPLEELMIFDSSGYLLSAADMQMACREIQVQNLSFESLCVHEGQGSVRSESSSSWHRKLLAFRDLLNLSKTFPRRISKKLIARDDDSWGRLLSHHEIPASSLYNIRGGLDFNLYGGHVIALTTLI